LYVEERTVDKILIQGGRTLRGEVEVSGSKNAALPNLIASLLTDEECVFTNVPNLNDVSTAMKLLHQLGAKAERTEAGVMVQAHAVRECLAPYDLVRTMRASFLVLGPLLARFGIARVSTPGGCAIGNRPVNIHLDGLERMGATVFLRSGYVEARARRLRGAKLCLDFPSVGATENLIMAATLAEGTTVIENAAREPEIVDLCSTLTAMGARIEGSGSAVICIEGVRNLHGVRHRVIADRIEAGTFMVAASLCQGDVTIRGACLKHLDALAQKLVESGSDVSEKDGCVRVKGNGRPKSLDIETMPYPGFPTDLQAQVMVLMAVGTGSSVITETIFENRFMHVQELRRMGADIRVEGNRAFVKGVPELLGAPVMATDLRASVSLILAGLVARDLTQVSRVYHLDRGYERIEEKFAGLGAVIERCDS
jgi:UDP-N-acetylglucosamine 1-carboxyvinyltransferase